MEGLERLLAIEDIKVLEARRGRALDAQDWPAYGALHVADIIFEAGAEPLQGVDAMTEWLARELAGAVTVHHVHSPEISFSATHLAHGIWVMEAMTHYRRENAAASRHSYGYYHVDYVRHDGVWKIARRKQVRVRVDTTETTLPG